MEFDNNSPISDEQRHLAETKKVTLQPLHTDVKPEDAPDAEIVAQHMHEAPIANIPSDTEEDTVPVQSSRNHTTKFGIKANAVVLAITVPVVAIAVTLVFLLTN